MWRQKCRGCGERGPGQPREPRWGTGGKQQTGGTAGPRRRWLLAQSGPCLSVRSSADLLPCLRNSTSGGTPCWRGCLNIAAVLSPGLGPPSRAEEVGLPPLQGALFTPCLNSDYVRSQGSITPSSHTSSTLGSSVKMLQLPPWGFQ